MGEKEKPNWRRKGERTYDEEVEDGKAEGLSTVDAALDAELRTNKARWRDKGRLVSNGLVCPEISEPGMPYPCQGLKCAWYDAENGDCGKFIADMALAYMADQIGRNIEGIKDKIDGLVTAVDGMAPRNVYGMKAY